MTTYKKVAALAKLGPVTIISERKHHHGHRTKPYVIERTYEDESGTIRITTTKNGGCYVNMALLSWDNNAPKWTKLLKTWEPTRKHFFTVKAAVAWICR